LTAVSQLTPDSQNSTSSFAVKIAAFNMMGYTVIKIRNMEAEKT
jgi:hypothetical protein